MINFDYAKGLEEAAKRYDQRHDDFAEGKATICRDLARYYTNHNRLFASQKQAEFADKLIAWSQPKVAAPVGQVNEKAIGRVLALFAKARESGLKFPRIRLQTPGGAKLVIALAGERSRYQGCLQLTDGNAFGANVYYGRIEPDGSLVASRQMTDQVRDLLLSLGDNPERAAEAYGRLTSSCCFCGLRLTDGRSIAMGYGPICAGKYGLDWGTEKVAVVVEEQGTV